ncbi:MAG TPA: alpha/beta hydrolase [Bacteroidia bacterium]|nr:alpha/beta hydrolase [Bacteroidia bacterium]
MIKKTLIVIGLFVMAMFLQGCYMLKKYVYTDDELAEHYKTRALKPVYKKLDFINRQLHYATMSRSDTLPLLLLVHGAPGAWYGYLNLMDDSLLQANFKIVSVDRLGYGKSNYGVPELSVQMQALEIKRIIEEENNSGKKVFLIGRSYGAPIVAWYAINYPQVVEKLLMVSPVIDPDREKFYWFSSIGRAHLVQLLLPKMLNVATKEKYSHADQMKKMLPKWKRLYSKTYVITGENDHLADTANFSFAKKKMQNCNCTFMKLKNTGHQVTRQHPELIKSLLLEKNG